MERGIGVRNSARSSWDRCPRRHPNPQRKQQTNGQSKFHDALRTLLKQNRNDSTHNLTLFEDQFVEHVKNWYWLGETLVIASTLGMNDLAFRSHPWPYKFNSGTSQYSSWGATLGNMADALRAVWSD